MEIYTRSAYTTRDLDFVAATTEALKTTMLGLGFEQEGRHWLHKDLGIVVEFPGTTIAPARAVSIDVDGSELRIIQRAQEESVDDALEILQPSAKSAKPVNDNQLRNLRKSLKD